MQNDTPFPPKVDDFFEQLIVYVPPDVASFTLTLPPLSSPVKDGLPGLSDAALSALKGSDGSGLFDGLKAAADLAVYISPLTLLTPVAFKRWSMDRQRLIEVSLGRDRLFSWRLN